MAEYLTYREAARRVRRSVRTIKRWRRAGLPMSFDEHGRRVVDEQILLKWWRARMNADPVHRLRLRQQKLLVKIPPGCAHIEPSGDKLSAEV